MTETTDARETRNEDTNERKHRRVSSRKRAEMRERVKREDEREWRSISRQILEVQELTRETDGEGKTEEAA